MEKTALKTSIGTFIGNMHEDAREFLGIPYARAGRFEYGERIDRYEDVFDATKM